MSDELNRAPDDLERDLLAVLRADTPRGMSDAEREEILRGAELSWVPRRPLRTRFWMLSAALLSCFVLSTAAYFGIVRPEQQRIAAARVSAERLAVERAAEAEKAARIAREKLEAAARRHELEARMRAETAADAALNATPPKGSESRAKKVYRGGRASIKAGPARRAASVGGCDPNDPLCGL